MGDDEADESDDAAGADGERHHEGGGDEEYAFHLFDLDTHAACRLAAGEEEVEVAAVPEDGADAGDGDGCEDGDVGPGGAAEGAHGPEDDGVHLLLVEDHEEGDECGDEECEADAGEEESGGVHAVADGGDFVDKHHSGQRTPRQQPVERPEQRCREGESADAPEERLETEENGDGGTQGGTAADAEDIGVGEGVAEDALVGGAADGEDCADECAHHDARQAQLPEYLGVPYLVPLEVDGAEEAACRHGGEEQEGEQQEHPGVGAGGGMCAGVHQRMSFMV